MRKVVITADDLGIALETNAAVEVAHREGILTSASLMANMPAFADAVAIAHRNPQLGIGVHLVLTSGRPVLPPQRVPLLVDARGRFRHGYASLSRLLLGSQREAGVRDGGEAQAVGGAVVVEVALLPEAREVVLHRRGCEPSHLAAELADARHVAVPRGEALDGGEDLPLLARELRATEILGVGVRSLYGHAEEPTERLSNGQVGGLASAHGDSRPRRGSDGCGHVVAWWLG